MAAKVAATAAAATAAAARAAAELVEVAEGYLAAVVRVVAAAATREVPFEAL